MAAALLMTSMPFNVYASEVSSGSSKEFVAASTAETDVDTGEAGDDAAGAVESAAEEEVLVEDSAVKPATQGGKETGEGTDVSSEDSNIAGEEGTGKEGATEEDAAEEGAADNGKTDNGKAGEEDATAADSAKSDDSADKDSTDEDPADGNLADADSDLLLDEPKGEELVGDDKEGGRPVRILSHNAKWVNIFTGEEVRGYQEEALAESPISVTGDSLYIHSIESAEGYNSLSPSEGQNLSCLVDGALYLAEPVFMDKADKLVWEIYLKDSFFEGENQEATVELFCPARSYVGLVTPTGTPYFDLDGSYTIKGGVEFSNRDEPFIDAENHMIPTGDEIVIDVIPYAGYVPTVEYLIDGEENKPFEKKDNTTYYIPEEITRKAFDEKKNISIYIRTEKRDVPVEFRYVNGRSNVYRYQRVRRDSHDVIMGGDTKGDLIAASTTAGFNTDFEFVVEPVDSKDGEVIVTANGQELAPIQDHYYKDESDAANKIKTDSMKYYRFAAGEKNTVEIRCVKVDQPTEPIAVTPTISQVTLKGFKNKAISQVSGTTVNYPVTLKAGEDYNDLRFESGDGESSFDLEYSPDKKLLTVSTFKDTALSDEDIIIKALDTTDTLIDTFTIHPTAAKFAAPTVKVTETRDVGIVLSLGLPKGAAGSKNLYYKVEAEAVGTVDDRMLARTEPMYLPVEETLCPLTLAKSTQPDGHVMLGDGTAQKYNISVSLVQVVDDSFPSDNDRFAEGNILTEGTVKVLKNQATKNPAYETKLTFTKKAVSVIYGEDDQLIGPVKFSANTTYRIVRTAQIVSERGEVMASNTAGDLKTDYRTGAISWDSYPEDLQPGKYTLEAYPDCPEETFVQPATLTLTVKPAVNNIVLTPSGDDVSFDIYKAKGKAASYKLKATAEAWYATGQLKPANSKLAWECDSDNPELKKYLTVKNGTVTVAKNYELSEEAQMNKFRVRAVALDRKTNPAVSDWTVFRITDSPAVPATIAVGEAPDAVVGDAKTPVKVVSSELNRKPIHVLDSEGKEIPLGDLTLSVSPAKGFTIDPDDYTVEITKLGTYTVKAVRNDGSKKSVTAKFAVVSDEINPDYPYDFKIQYAQQLSQNRLNKITMNEDNEAYVNGASVIAISSRAITQKNGLYSGGISVAVKGARKLSVPAYAMSDPAMQYFYYKPTKKDMEFTISSKDGLFKKTTYKIHNVVGDGILKANKKGYTFYTNDLINTKTIDFELSGLDISESDKDGYVLRFDPDDKDLSKSDEYFSEVCEFCENALNSEFNTVTDIAVHPDDKPKATVVSKNLLPGLFTTSRKVSMNLYASLWKVGDTQSGTKDTQVTAPVKITIKFTDPPKPAVTLNKKVTLGRKRDADPTDTAPTSAKIIKSIKNGKIKSVQLLNDNNGQIIDAKKYLTVEKDPETGEWVLRRTYASLPDGMKSITCWIKYDTYTFTRSVTTPKSEKITVNFK